MDSNLHKLVYCSRNRIPASSAAATAELQTRLASSRKNNPPLALTGALLYNDGNFAQVLEGPLASIERIFETIQCDARHSEVTVVYNGPALRRDFPDWSMAFSGGASTGNMSLASAAFDAAFAHAEGAGERMLATLKELVVLEDDWMLAEAL